MMLSGPLGQAIFSLIAVSTAVIGGNVMLVRAINTRSESPEKTVKRIEKQARRS